MMFNRDVHLCGCSYDFEPFTGFCYTTIPEGQWFRAEAPRLEAPAFAPPDQHFMRDPSLVTTWAPTGGTTIQASGFRSLNRPWHGG